MSHAASSTAGHSHAAHGHESNEAHGAHGHDEHAHHMIVPRRLLLTVLGVLMFFTLLTVGAAQLEQFIAHRFDVVIPQWVNVFVALSIAGIKTLFVMAIFMQLRWDNPFNSLIMAFTVFTLCFFLGFIMIDLGNRQAIYSYKGQYIVEGGSGNIDASSGDVPAGTSIAMQARVWAMEEVDRLLIKEKLPLPSHLVVFCSQEIDRRLAKGDTIDKMPPGLQEFDRSRNDPRYVAILSGHAHAHAAAAGPNSAAQSRLRTGLTDPEFGAKAGPHGADGSHGDSGPHGGDSKSESKSESKSDAAPAAKPAAGH